MSLFGIFGGDSKSSTSTSTSDQKVAADNGASANRIDTSGDVVIGSDSVAQAAISAGSQNAALAIQNTQALLAQSTSFLDKELTNFFNVIDHRAASADANVAASQTLAAQVVGKSQETQTDSLIKLVTVLAVAGVAYIAFKSGAIKL